MKGGIPMQIRKMLAAFISFMMIYPVVSVSAFAVDETQIVTDLVSPAYEYAAKTENYLTITSSTADCKSLCNGMAGVTQITVEHTLEKHWGLWIWNEVDGASWSHIISGSSGKVTNSKSGLESGTYRLKSVFTLTTLNGETETITVYSDEKTRL